MWKLSLLLSIGLLAGVFAAEESTYQNAPKAPPAAQAPKPTPAPYQAPQKAGVKNLTASGRYNGGGDHDGHDYGHGHHHGHKIFRGFDAPLIDDYICDLDATILVVTNSDTSNGYMPANDNSQAGPAPEAADYSRAKRSAYLPPEYDGHRGNYGPPRDYNPPREHYGPREHYDDYGGPVRDHYAHHEYDRHSDYERDHGYGAGVAANADRLRCSIIAGIDEDSCTTCCRLSARRDRSISKDKIIGFLVDNNQVSYEAQPSAGEGYGEGYPDRKKRSDSATYDQAYVPPVEVPTPEGDYRCVCCAPKRYRPFIFDRFFRRHHHGGPY